MNMMNTKTRRTSLVVSALLLTAFFSGQIFADSHGHHKNMMSEEGHGHSKGDSGTMAHGKGHGGAMQNVTGHGVLNKVMSKAHMVSITHEPMHELNWPKMKMNFKVDQSIDLSGFEPGQQVEFTLEVMEDNNYLIKDVKAKQ